ncbi:MAG: GNAT family N-acetyltransferase [Pseudomonadota bacterium]|uniref:GNAT family N-acetyltransferase n=1 Tax=Roseovarius salincola TaxID=2978479 RepID=UPI0022A7549B|nr:GNAT family N-acetyltransferase [Roseovarius sp. EGI FJ00037]MCZ0811597.1 GNAT family N-acetyltransferase [Roseovarius sp. EGI FJ00037]
MSDSPTFTAPGQNLVIRPFTTAHLPGALLLSQQVGWPHRLEDWALNLALSQGVVALDGARVAGTTLCTRFGDVALLNMIIVDGAMRGRGLGRMLMAAAMELAAGCEMRLIATPEGQPLYEKLGFHPTGQILQHQGISQGGAPALPVREGRAQDVTELARMDLAATGLERSDMIARIAGTGTVLRADHGFALLRAFGRGHVLGPVVACDTATARALIDAGARRMAGRFLRIDLPEGAGLSDHVTRLGLAHAGSGTAMIRPPCGPAAGGDFTTFALASQALG